MTMTPEAVSVVPCVEMPCQTEDAKGSPERGASAPRSLVEYDDYGIERWALSQTSAGKLYSYRDVLKDAKGIGSPKRYQPGRSLGDGKRDQATGGEQSMEGSRLELFAAYDSLYPDDPIGDETPPSPGANCTAGSARVTRKSPCGADSGTLTNTSAGLWRRLSAPSAASR
jgi:hypothetical protein